jgi:hypothetical protein
MPQRSTAAQQAPANLAPLVAAVAVLGGLAALVFQLPGAVIIAVGIALASVFFNAPPLASAKEPHPDKVQQQIRRWQDLRWRTIIPNGDWVLNEPSSVGSFRDTGRALVEKLGSKLPSAVKPAAGFLGEALGAISWVVLPTRFLHLVAIGAALAVLTLPANLVLFSQWFTLSPELLSLDLVWVNAIYAYGTVMAVDAAVRRTASIDDPSPGVPISALTSEAKAGDGGAWRALIGFGFLGAVIAVGVLLAILSAGVAYLFVPPFLLGAGLGLAAAAGALHGVARNDALEAWRDQVAARAQWVPRWEAMKNPDVRLVSHERVGSFVVDTFEAPPSLGSAKAINLYNTVVPYLAAGGEVNVAMLTVPATDSQGQPLPGSAHATRFRVVVAPGDAEVQTLDPNVNVEELGLAAEVGAFHAARELNTQVPILLDLTPAHTPDSKSAVWQTTWTVPLASAVTVAYSLGVDPDSGIFSEGRATFFGDFQNATLSDRTLPARMEKAAYEARWVQRWSDALKMGEKPPHLQYGAIKREKLTPAIELTYEPFLVSQGLTTAPFFTKDMRTRLATTLKAAPFIAVIGLTGQLAAAAGQLGAGVRHAQGFCVVHSATPVPANPAEIASPGPRAREVAKWVMGGIINRAFEDAKLPYPEVISAEALTRTSSKGHVWKIHLRLYEGVTAATLKLNAVKLAQAMGGVRWLRFEESDLGCYIVAGAMPHAEGVKFSNAAALAYCDKLDWAQAFQDVGVRSVSDGATPMMLENAPLETNDKVTQMTFTMPQGLNLGKVVEATDKLRSATANDYVEIRAAETPDKFVVLAAEQNPIPFPAYPDYELLASTEGKKRTRLPFAATTDGSTVSFDWTLDPHLNVLGASGGGKSILLQMLMVGAIFRDCDVFLLDPIKGGQDFDFAVPYVRAMVPQGDYLGAGELMQIIGQEAEDRKKLNVQYKVGNYKDLPAEVRPRHMFVIIDEFQSLLKSRTRALKEPTGGDETEMLIYEAQRNINTGVGKVATHIGKLAREARSVGITLVLAGQAMKAVDLEAVGLGGLKVNFSRIAVGKMSYGEMASAFKDPATLPNLGAVVPPGRGIFESTAAAAITVQNWWEPDGQEELGRQLALRVQPIDDSRRVNVEELSARVLNASPKAFGALVDEEFQVEDDEEEIQLDASELGLDLGGLSFDDSFSFDDEPSEDDTFTLEEPPTGAPIAAAVPDEAGTEPGLVPGEPGGRPLFDLGQFAEMTTGLHGRVVVGRDVVFGENAPTGDGYDTGWPEGDALQLLLAANPGISEVVWADPMLAELDDIGIPREDIARDIADRHGVTLLTEEQDKAAPEPAIAPEPEPEPQPQPQPEPVHVAAPASDALFDLADFDGPTVAVPDMTDADELFASPKTNAPKVDVEF